LVDKQEFLTSPPDLGSLTEECADDCPAEFGFNFNLPCADLDLNATVTLQHTAESPEPLPLLEVQRQGVQVFDVQLEPDGPLVQVTQGPTGPCDYDFEMNFVLPCPQLVGDVQVFVVNDPPESTLDITPVLPPAAAEGTCEFQFDLTLFIPPTTDAGSVVSFGFVQDFTISCNASDQFCASVVISEEVTTPDGITFPANSAVTACSDFQDGIAAPGDNVILLYTGNSIWRIIAGETSHIEVLVLDNMAPGELGNGILQDNAAIQVPVTVFAPDFWVAKQTFHTATWNKKFCRWDLENRVAFGRATQSACAGEQVVVELIAAPGGAPVGRQLNVSLTVDFEGMAIAAQTEMFLTFNNVTGETLGEGVGATFLCARLDGTLTSPGDVATATVKYLSTGGFVDVPNPAQSLTVEAPDCWSAWAFDNDTIAVKCVKAESPGFAFGTIMAMNHGRWTIKGDLNGQISGAGGSSSINVAGSSVPVQAYFDGELESGTKVMAVWDEDDEAYLIFAADCEESS
jgi:hypothetical protein